MTTASPALDYELGPPLAFHRRKWFRLALLLTVLGVVAGVAERWGPEAWRRWQLAYWQSRCLRYAPPGDRVVYDDGPGGATLATLPHYARVPNPNSGIQGGATPTPPAAVLVPECWQRFVGAVRGAPPGPEYVPLFLHERTTPGGERRLVAVLYRPSPMAGFSTAVNLLICAVTPGTNGRPPSGLWLEMMTCTSYARESGPRTLRIFAGQPDPADRSRFTIRFVHNGRSRVMEGRLSDDGGIPDGPGVRITIKDAG